MDQGLPVYTGPVDHLRYGFHSLENEKSAPHPVSVFQKNRGEAEWVVKMDAVRRTYGSHMAMRLSSEKAMFSRYIYIYIYIYMYKYIYIYV
jgi:hypothetical protein